MFTLFKCFQASARAFRRCSHHLEGRPAVTTLLLLLAWVGGAAAQPDAGPVQTYAGISALLEAGFSANPRVQAAYARWETARLVVPARKALPEPALSYVHYLESVETKVGPQEGAMQLSQRLPFPGKLRLAGRVAQAQAAAARHAYVLTVQQVAAEIEAAWWDYLYLRQALSITADYVALYRNWEQVALSKYATAQAGHPDVIRAQVEVLQLEDRLETLRRRQRPLLERLSAALGIPLRDDQLPGTAIPRLPRPPTVDSLMTEVYRANPRLLMSQAQAQAARQGTRRARLNYLPDFSIGGNLIRTGELAGVSASGQDALMLTVGITLPVRFRKYKALHQSARAAQRAAELDVRSLQDRLRADVELTLFDLDDAHRKIRLYEEALIPRAEQNLQASEKAYVTDKVDFLTLVEAQRALFEFQLTYQRARANQARHNARLNGLLGNYTVKSTALEDQ